MTVTEHADLVAQFSELEAEVARERGPFALFALFLREDAPDRWDLIVSAPWTGADRRSVVEYFVDQIKSRFGEQALIRLSRIVNLDPQHPAVQELNRAIPVEHGRVEVRDTTFFGQAVRHAYIITSRQLEPVAAAA